MAPQAPGIEMRVLITGARGQLAGELVRRAPEPAMVRSVSRAECDITDIESVRDVVRVFSPEVVINAASYTAVDLAEEARDEAFAVNDVGARNVAVAAGAAGAYVIQISTDYVFDGRQSTPYSVDAEPNPLSVYGQSKLAGERAILEGASAATVVRCGWLYSSVGKNFLTTILHAISQRTPVRVVNDQVGVPTTVGELTDFLWWLAGNPSSEPLMHWANGGQASWHEFAVAIAEMARDHGLAETAYPIEPITTSEWKARARRPAYSALDATESWTRSGMTARPWREALASVMDELVTASA